MVTFSHREAGTPGQRWRDAGVDALPELPPAALPGAGGTAVVVVPHPDDEALGAAGFILRAAAAGASVTVLLCTAGEASHPGSPTHTPDRLARLRLAEFAASMGIASTTSAIAWRFLDLPDGGISGHTGPLREEIVRALRSGSADGIRGGVVAAPYRSDGHPDHEAAGRAAADAAREAEAGLVEFPVWYWHWAQPEEGSWRRWRTLRLSPRETGRKREMLGVHRTQVADLSPAPGDEALLPAGFRGHFDRGVEVFAWTPAPGPGAGTRSSGDVAGPPRGAGTAAEDFDALYRRDPDPWAYLSSWYERRKRTATLAALPRARYANAVEAGCSIGVLTAELAARCDRLEAVDASAVALGLAADRLADRPHVRLRRAELPAGWTAPAASVDLVVVSEIGYFLAPRELDGLLDAAWESLLPGGHLVLCHWLGPIEGWALDGEAVHAAARRRTASGPVVAHREREFLLEVFEAPGSSA
ncbi:bifunctional PIG-L family deacetylase/class I SAM-dependent methyltransferase [Zafaria sp. J156]|uniref:bifunctional PIG-L family deacetylase/class I SAM-dependent methyltransferase n=1 Tax=Zafaria sp. J156 TaxID=3116490 RepID=UPI002E778D2F|nr:bifunctional PIG-L family deacetylase/class I SAM-dependent methyltransferase [Zafaria sp. J156]MEE1621905.1 bifunctional PIG-L family deacetylase/class I SAM-dependent methyltransferase [Zafaria sp. J156]